MKKILCSCAAALVCLSLTAQKVRLIDNTDKVRPGARKELLGNIYTAVTSSTSTEDGTINIKFTPYGLISPFRPSLDSLDKYVANKWMRKIQFNGSLTPEDSSLFKFGTGGVGITFTLWDKTDKTLANYHNEYAKKMVDETANILANLTAPFRGDARKVREGQLRASFNRFGKDGDWDALDPDIKTAFTQEFKDHPKEFKTMKELIDVWQTSYKQLVRNLSLKPLLTFTPQMKYNFNKHSADNVLAKVNFQIGFRKKLDQNPWFLQLAVKYTFDRDTMNKVKENNLDHAMLSVQPSFNMVLKRAKEKDDPERKSQIELQPYLRYNPATKNWYTGENDQTLTPGVTARARLAGDTWLPVTIEYDSRHGKFFGFLSIYWSLD